MRKIQTLCRSAIVILIGNGFSALATVHNSDGSYTSIQYIHDTLAQDGDTITMPNGTFSWTGTLRLTKSITLKGNTTTDPASGTAVSNTVVIDNESNRNNPLISIDANGGQRITGIAFERGSTSVIYNGGIRLEHGTTPVRIDHCYFHDVYWQPMLGWYDYNYGVLDHNVQKLGHGGFVYCHMGAHGNGGDLGDYSFENPAGFGGPNFLFVEDNWIEHGPDITVGGKVCGRYNHVHGEDGVSNGEFVSHGTARTYTNGRGGRCYEIYNNDFHYNNDYKGIDGPDSGSAVWHDNTFTNNGLHLHQIDVQVYRSAYSFGVPFYGADGANGWDSNDPHGLYHSGTISGTNGSNTVTDSSKNWIPNQWVGYSIRRPSDGAIGSIISNTATTLTLYVIYSEGWSVGSSYEIRKVLRILDQPGLGAGDHINRNSPAWPNQVNEPMYSWNNVNLDNGSQINFEVSVGSFTILEGRDFFNDTPLPGYTPYVYPHPLVTDAPPPSPTPSATVMPSPTATATPAPSPTSPPSPTPPTTPTATPTPRHTPRPRPSHAPNNG
jgi:hypothetical protein